MSRSLSLIKSTELDDAAVQPLGAVEKIILFPWRKEAVGVEEEEKAGEVILEQAKGHANDLLKNALTRANEIKTQARKELQQEINLEKLSAISAFQREIEENRAEIANLVYQCAEKVVGSLTKGKRIEKLIEKAVDDFIGEHNIIVRAHPDNAELVEKSLIVLRKRLAPIEFEVELMDTFEVEELHVISSRQHLDITSVRQLEQLSHFLLSTFTTPLLSPEAE